jgi:hypothetical protein
MTTFRQLLKEFWFPALAAIAWSIANFNTSKDQAWSWTSFINIAAPTFFFVSWLTSQYFRVKKQEHVASTLDKIETRVQSVMTEVEQQARGLKYLADAQVFQTFDECIDRFREAKEEIADKSRQVKAGEKIDSTIFSLNRENPFYSARRYLSQLISYGVHTVFIGRQGDLEKRFSLAAMHVEELAGNIGTFIGRMNNSSIPWKTPRSVAQVTDICNGIDRFLRELSSHSKYPSHPYKGSQSYVTVIEAHLANLRSLVQ